MHRVVGVYFFLAAVFLRAARGGCAVSAAAAEAAGTAGVSPGGRVYADRAVGGGVDYWDIVCSSVAAVYQSGGKKPRHGSDCYA